MQNYPYLLSHYTHTPPTPSEGVILRDLIDREHTTKERLIEQLYAHREDGGPLSANHCIKEHVHRLRGKLVPCWRIDRDRRSNITLKEN